MKKLLSSITLLSAMVLTGAGSAMADVFPSDGSEITLGNVYDVELFQTINATVTPTTSGILLKDGGSDISVEGANETYYGYCQYGQMFGYAVTAGTTYNLTGWCFSNGPVKFDMADVANLAIVSSTPDVGDTYSVAYNSGSIDIKFNQPVTYSSATVSFDDHSTSLGGKSTANTVVSVNPKDAVSKWYAAGYIKGGETLTVTLGGVKDLNGELYNGDGVMSVEYILAAPAISVTSESIAAITAKSFLSYYAPSNEDGVFVFEFTGDIDPNTIFATVSAGSPESEATYWYETSEENPDIDPSMHINLTVDGNKAILDLRGKLRDMNHCLLDGQSNIWTVIKLSNIHDLDGNLALSNFEGGQGSVAVTLCYQYIAPANIVSEFVPESGSNIAATDRVEIWFNNANVIKYDGVDFEFGGTVVNVPLSEIEVTVEGNEHTLLVPVPEAAKSASNVNVALSGLESLDGYEHSDQISAIYNACVINLVGPFAPGAAIASTGEDDFTFTVAGEPIPGYIRYDFYNEADANGDPQWIYGSWLTLQDNGYWTSYNGNYTCYDNFEPFMVVRGYNNEGEYWQGLDPICTYRFSFVGTTKAFEYSTYNMESITPEPGTTLTDLDNVCFNVKYDGLVRIDETVSGVVLGMGMGTKPFSLMERVGATDNDPEGFASEWNLYVDPSVVKGETNTSIEIAIKAYDLTGNVVKGNMDAKEYDYYSASYPVVNADNVKEVTLFPAAGSSVDELLSIEVSFDGMAVGRDWNCTAGSPYIVNKLMETVYTFTDNDIEIYSDIIGYDELNNPIYDEITSAILHINPSITVEGAYTLIIPEGYFAIGSQFVTYSSAAVNATYYVGMAAPTFLNVEPSDGETLTDLPNILINTSAGINPDCLSYITLENNDIWYNASWSIYGGLNNSIVTRYDDANEVIGYTLNFNDYSGAVPTEAGVYTLTIPAGFFILNGETNDGMILTYNLGGGNSGVELTVNPAPGVVESLGSIEILADGIEDAMIVSSEPIVITNQNFEQVYTISAADLDAKSFDWDTFTFNGFVLEPNITEPGTYYLNIPAGYFEFSDMSKSKALTAVYNILPEPTIELDITPSHQTTVSHLDSFIINCSEDIYTNDDQDGVVTIEHDVHGLIHVYTPSDIDMMYNWDENRYEILVNDPLANDADYANARTAKTAGVYTLTIPSHFFCTFNEYSKECIAVITVDGSESGITQVVVDKADSYVVYDLRGVKVLETVDASGLSSLRKGVYVVNGKKVLVK